MLKDIYDVLRNYMGLNLVLYIIVAVLVIVVAIIWVLRKKRV
jgi:hypothetical protein